MDDYWLAQDSLQTGFTPYMQEKIEQTPRPFSRARNLGLKSQLGHLSGPAQTDEHGRLCRDLLLG